MAVSIYDVAKVCDGTVHPVVNDESDPPRADISTFTHDSREVASGGLFACVSGEHFDGHQFAGQAAKAGAVALLVDHLVDVDLPQIVVAGVRASLGPVADLVNGRPSDSLTVIGVTGTSGKTTVVHLLQSVLSHCGVLTEAVGTLTGTRTTPEAPELQAQLADMVDRGVGAVAMEVSSHALSLGRVKGTRFRLSVFTNLGHDHLDFHHTMDAYREAKVSLFDTAYSAISVVNRDDRTGRLIADTSNTRVLTYGLEDARDLLVDGPSSRFTWRGQQVKLNLAGRYNVLNGLAVATAAEALGHNPQVIAEALSLACAPPGRFELVPTEGSFLVAVDYAHKPEALAAALDAAHQVAGDGRVLVVFGCGGDRDREKRPLMGQAAAAGADRVIVTSDNPRTESPEQIVDEIVAGIPTGTELLIEIDRTEAIASALRLAQDGDLVLIAGKGHETYQEVGGQRVDFDDRLITLGLLEKQQ